MIILTTLSNLATLFSFLNNRRGEVVYIAQLFLSVLRIHVYYFHPLLMGASVCGFYSVCRCLADQRHQPMLKVLILKPNKDYSKMESSLTWRKYLVKRCGMKACPLPGGCVVQFGGDLCSVFHLCCDRQ